MKQPNRLTNKFRGGILAAVCVSLLSNLTPALAQNKAEIDALNNSTLVFVGEVTRLRAATMSIVPISDNTIVVRVWRVVKADPLMDYQGREITLLVKDPKPFKVKSQFIFYTKGWLTGESVAMQLIYFKSPPEAASASDVEGFQKNLVSRLNRAGVSLLSERLGKSALTVEGRVLSIEPVEVVPVGEAAPGGPRAPGVSIEDDPQLRRAVVEVTAKLFPKAGEAPKTVTVLFPTSRNVTWDKAPRLEVGSAGLFILERAETNDILKRILKLAGGKIVGGEKDYIILDASDFHPPNESQRVRDAVKLLDGND